jgi:hypothetical protein
MFYERFIWRAAQHATHQCTIHTFASSEDLALGEARWLQGVLRDHPTVKVELEVEEYGQHQQVMLPFFRFLQRKLYSDVTGWREYGAS